MLKYSCQSMGVCSVSQLQICRVHDDTQLTVMITLRWYRVALFSTVLITLISIVEPGAGKILIRRCLGKNETTGPRVKTELLRALLPLHFPR